MERRLGTFYNRLQMLAKRTAPIRSLESRKLPARRWLAPPTTPFGMGPTTGAPNEEVSTSAAAGSTTATTTSACLPPGSHLLKRNARHRRAFRQRSFVERIHPPSIRPISSSPCSIARYFALSIALVSPVGVSPYNVGHALNDGFSVSYAFVPCRPWGQGRFRHYPHGSIFGAGSNSVPLGSKKKARPRGRADV
jgi:hypothetical protein